MILEQHGYPPLVLSFESIDNLDHVLFVYRHARTLGLGRPITRSRAARPQAGVPHARDLALSYVDPYIDFSGRVTGYAVVDLRVLGDYDWRLSEQNVWKVERLLLELSAPAASARRTNGSIDCARWYRHYRETSRTEARSTTGRQWTELRSPELADGVQVRNQ